MKKLYCPVTTPILNQISTVSPAQIFTDSDDWILEARSRIESEPEDQTTFRMRGFCAVAFMAAYILQGRGSLSTILKEHFAGRVPADVFQLRFDQTAQALAQTEQRCAELLDAVELDLAHYKLIGQKRPFTDIDEAFVERVRALGAAAVSLRSSLKSRGTVSRTVGMSVATYLIAARNEHMCRELVSRLVTINPSNPFL